MSSRIAGSEKRLVDLRYSRFIPFTGERRAELFLETKNLFNTENVAGVNRVVNTDSLGNLSDGSLPGVFPRTSGYDQRIIQAGVKFAF